ncbi:MAG: hypothetical protein AAF641_16510 [Pseudomonadota bacterium]
MENCYAHVLGDCSNKLSKEHYISQALLKLSEPDPGRVKLAGDFANAKPRGTQNLAQKRMLCTQHNSELSAVDAEMVSLAQAVYEWGRSDRNLAVSVDGTLLTRWLFKFAIGQMWATVGKELIPQALLSKDCLEFVFGRAPLPIWCGFEASGPTEHTSSVVNQKEGAPAYITSILRQRNGEPCGSQIALYPLEFFALFRPTIASQSSSFRLDEIYVETKDQSKILSIIVAWPESTGRCMRITTSGQ